MSILRSRQGRKEVEVVETVVDPDDPCIQYVPGEVGVDKTINTQNLRGKSSVTVSQLKRYRRFLGFEIPICPTLESSAEYRCNRYGGSFYVGLHSDRPVQCLKDLITNLRLNRASPGSIDATFCLRDNSLGAEMEKVLGEYAHSERAPVIFRYE